MITDLRNLTHAGVTLDESFQYLAVYQYVPNENRSALRTVIDRRRRMPGGRELAMLHDLIGKQWPGYGTYIVVAARGIHDLRDSLTSEQELAIPSEWIPGKFERSAISVAATAGRGEPVLQLVK